MRAVASAMEKGTSRILARVWAEQGLAAAGGPQEEDVALLQLYVVVLACR